MELSQSFLLTGTFIAEGFFDVDPDLVPQIRADDGPVTLLLGENAEPIEVHVKHEVHFDGRARIIGGAALREWFGAYWEPDIRVLLHILEPNRFSIRRLWRT